AYRTSPTALFDYPPGEAGGGLVVTEVAGGRSCPAEVHAFLVGNPPTHRASDEAQRVRDIRFYVRCRRALRRIGAGGHPRGFGPRPRIVRREDDDLLA